MRLAGAEQVEIGTVNDEDMGFCGHVRSSNQARLSHFAADAGILSILGYFLRSFARSDLIQRGAARCAWARFQEELRSPPVQSYLIPTHASRTIMLMSAFRVMLTEFLAL
jgi:hypothetical protein